MSQKLGDKRRNLWTSFAKERRLGPELTAAMTLEESLQNSCTIKYEIAYLGGSIILEKSLYCSINAVLSGPAVSVNRKCFKSS